MNIETITETICRELHIELSALKTKSRKRELVEARQLAMYFCRKHEVGTFTAIGMYFGGRDHSTVIHSCQTVEDLIETNKPFKRIYDTLDGMIVESMNSVRTLDPYSFSMLSLAAV